MGSFTVKRSALTLLLILLAVITLVLVLPHVDLMDTAFLTGTSPLVARARVHSVPSLLILLSPFRQDYIAEVRQDRGEKLPGYAIAQSLHILKHSLRC
jgi:hypothetical protein